MAGIAAWAAWCLAVRWVVRPGFRGGEPGACFAVRVIRAYARFMHALRVGGVEHVPARPPSGFSDRPLVIVSNHTSGVDPALIQAALGFEVRWVMAEDMRASRFEWFWEFARIIFVDREAGDVSGLREALRHLRAGGTLGIFPEGAIERPPRMLLPFREGVGVLIARSRALVLPVVVEGTPFAATAWGALGKPSRSTVRFLPVIDFSARATPAGEVAGVLQQVFAESTGWRVNEKPPKYEAGRWWYVDEAGAYRPES